MTWEWAFVISLAMICGTVLMCVKLFIPKKAESEVYHVLLSKMRAEADSMKADHERIEKLAEETKKLLSNANLAAGLRR